MHEKKEHESNYMKLIEVLKEEMTEIEEEKQKKMEATYKSITESQAKRNS